MDLEYEISEYLVNGLFCPSPDYIKKCGENEIRHAFLRCMDLLSGNCDQERIPRYQLIKSLLIKELADAHDKNNI